MQKPLEKFATAPPCPHNAELDERQITAPKSDVMLTIATSVNANRITTESNRDPPTKAEDTHSLERQEIASKLLKIGYISVYFRQTSPYVYIKYST